MALANALSHTNLKEFTPIFNLRALSFLSVSVLLGMGAYLFSKIDIRNSRQWRISFNSAMCIIILLFSAIEISDYFQKLALLENEYSSDQIRFLKLLSWSIGYALLSIFFILFGYRKNIIELIICGLLTLGLGVFLSVVSGITYIPIEQFTLVFNFRVFVLISIAVSLTIHLLLLKKYQDLFEWLNDIYKIFQVGIIIVILSLITGEIRDYYERAILFLNADSSEYLSKINLQQMVLSSSWLLFSIILLIIGIWRRNQIIRITAITIFGIAILKIFLYDLSFLETLYRIFSFIGLGIILLISSYLYQKYKKLIL